jgi:hypothetical protein
VPPPGAAQGQGSGLGGGTGFGGTGFGRPRRGAFQGGAPRGPGRGGGLGGLLDAGTPSPALVALLRSGSAGYRWAAAAVGANSAAGVQLASGKAILAIGGFNGTDPAPTLAQFKRLVARHEVHYFLGSGGRGLGGGDASSAIASWVAANFTATTVGGVTVYDLSNA